MKGTNCECEHVSHLDTNARTPNGNPGHIYGAAGWLNLQPVKTPYGTFHVCKDCADDCLREHKQ